MSTRSIFKASGAGALFVIAGLIAWRILSRQGGPLPSSQAIKDSLEVNRQLEANSKDSSIFHYKIYEKSIRTGGAIFSDSGFGQRPRRL